MEVIFVSFNDARPSFHKTAIFLVRSLVLYLTECAYCWINFLTQPQAICFVSFLIGFITVLCIGNYFRAKRAQERQRQRRMTKQAAMKNQQGMYASQAGDYRAPQYPAETGIQA